MAVPTNLRSSYKTPSGHDIPVVGFGVYLNPPNTTKTAVLKTLEVGYRHIDTAVLYKNEVECSEAIRESKIPRSEVYLTTKLALDEMGYENAKKAIDASLERTKEQYYDLFLIHAPYGGKDARLGAWKALSEAKKEGKIRSIGVSNFGVHHLDELEEYIKAEGLSPIDVGQYELHPWLPRPDIVSWLQKRNVVIEAYCPLTRAVRLEEPVLIKLGQKYKKTPSQILLRWSLQKDFVPLPKSVTPSRIAENADIFGFELSKEDMDSLHTEDYSPVTWDPTVDRS
ncbi:NADP-dependent oxidoreductase domain-containing protein [Xylogone sp. PMI_703]|nr:NADP-dependent oxidoreductase domain-containing protein [Xylogone sp. PMI_703]